MLRLARSLSFFHTYEDAQTIAQSFLAPTNGFNISVPTRNGLDNYHGPGTVFQGQLNLQLIKPIRTPCRLRVVFSGIHHVTPEQPLSSSPVDFNDPRQSSECAGMQQQQQQQQHQHCLFEIENVLIYDEPIQVKRHTFMFNIKFPRVNMPASMVDGERSVIYAIHGELTFQTNPEDPSTETTLVSPAVHLKYLPLVPTSIPNYPVIEMAQVMDPYSNRVLFKATLQSPQRGVCPGESLPLSLTIANSSETELQSIHLSLVRVISYLVADTASLITHHSPEPITVHTVTIPISQAPNKNSTWMEALQFPVPTSLGLIPTTNKVITPLFKVDYYLSVSMPVASRNTGLASWFTNSIKGPPPIDISLIRNATGSEKETKTGPDNSIDLSNSCAGSRKSSFDKVIKANLHMDRITTINSTMKWPTLIQLPFIPIIIGTVPYSVTERQLRWPVPNYLDVTDRPCFVRDRFEEEMMQQLKSLETLIVEEDDEQMIENIVQAAKRSTSSDESDEEDSKIPERFRNGRGATRRRGSQPMLGLGTPPPSPPSLSHIITIDGTVNGSNGVRSGIHTPPRVGRRSMSPKSGGLGKGLLMEMHHSKIQQNIQSDV
ncbi:hypothetical protein BG011_006256 [Mortierella polycephala]|uniref:Arrestin C-terminal-like domain-containing protein n=1 Tax=Mortierella polycephala TaxID=41804 RepID=A0A9P6PV98_9FUNG|nr:hypothetical protein BG011_006256 [Mortierella polycephala]